MYCKCSSSAHTCDYILLIHSQCTLVAQRPVMFGAVHLSLCHKKSTTRYFQIGMRDIQACTIPFDETNTSQYSLIILCIYRQHYVALLPSINYLHLHVVTALTFAKECQQKRKHKQGAVSIDSSIFFQGFLHDGVFNP